VRRRGVVPPVVLVSIPRRDISSFNAKDTLRLANTPEVSIPRRDISSFNMLVTPRVHRVALARFQFPEGTSLLSTSPDANIEELERALFQFPEGTSLLSTRPALVS